VYWLHDVPVVGLALGTTDSSTASSHLIRSAAGLGGTAARNGWADRDIDRRATSDGRSQGTKA
jgi:hypothetical protein